MSKNTKSTNQSITNITNPITNVKIPKPKRKMK